MHLRTNIWKYFVFSVTQRRHFIPLLSIFFLTLPDTTAKQIGFFTGVGFLMSFIFDIPSSYFADRVGHKATLVLSKVFMLLSTLSFVLAQNFWYFVFGSAFLNLGMAFSSGVGNAFMHSTMKTLKREKEYTKVMSNMAGFVSLISAVLIIGLPFFTKLSILIPFKIALVLDIVGLLVALSFVSPPQECDHTSHTFKSLVTALHKTTKQGFYPLAIFTGAITGFLIADGSYRYVYLMSLGYPIIFIGAVMGISRLVWFVVGYYAHHIERIQIETLMRIELFIFPISYVLIALFSNPYVVGIFFSIIIGYQFGRDQVYTAEFIRNLIRNQKYKATMLSITNLVKSIIQILISFIFAFIMQKSYKLGFFLLGITLFVILFIAYVWKLRVSAISCNSDKTSS